MGQCIQKWTKKNCGDMAKPYHFKFLKGFLSKTLLSPFLNTLTHILDTHIHIDRYIQ